MLTPYEHACIIRQAYEKATDRVCKKYKLKHREFDILMYLHNYPDQATATDIVKKENLSKSHVSVSLKALEERGYVSGEFRGSNRRTIYLRLNESASDIIEDGKNALCEFAGALSTDFTDNERAQLGSYLSRLKKNILAYIKTV